MPSARLTGAERQAEPTWHEVYGLPAPPPPPKPTRARLARTRRRAKFTARSYRRLSRLGAKVEYIAAVPGESTAQIRVDFGHPDDRFDFAALSIVQTGRLPRRRPCVARLPRGRRGRARAPRRSASSSGTSGADPPEDDEDPAPLGRAQVGWPYAVYALLVRPLPHHWRVRIYQALPERVQAFAARRLLAAVDAGRETIR